MRMLLIFLALAVIVMIAKRLWLQPRGSADKRKRLSGQMVQCAQCSMYVPEQEALQHMGQWYCSQEHREADRHRD
jgi:hypothetical protein